MIRETTAQQTDAVYLLVQCAMVLEYALQAAHAEWAKMRAELNQLRSTSSGSLMRVRTRGEKCWSPARTGVWHGLRQTRLPTTQCIEFLNRDDALHIISLLFV